MATQFVEGQPRLRERDEKTIETVGAGSLVEAFGGAAAVVLAIIALAGGAPTLLMTITTIVLGAALLVEGAAVLGRYERLLRDVEAPGGSRVARAELGSGMTAESVAGVAGVVLGILSLLGLAPTVLSPIALIVFGGGLVLGSAAVSRMNTVEYYGAGEATRRVMRELVNASASGQVLLGIGAVVLGILALLQLDPMTLTLVGFLAVGGAVLLSGS